MTEKNFEIYPMIQDIEVKCLKKLWLGLLALFDIFLVFHLCLRYRKSMYFNAKAKTYFTEIIASILFICL